MAWTSTEGHTQAVSGFYMGRGGLDPSDMKVLLCVGIMNRMGQSEVELKEGADGWGSVGATWK